MGWLGLGRRQNDGTRAEASAKVQALTRATLGLDDKDAVTVSEISCGDPGCGGSETVILVMRAGQRTRAVKVKKALTLVSDAEVVAALEASSAELPW